MTFRSSFLFALCATLPAASLSPSPSLRLDKQVVPVHYAAQLTIVPGQETFTATADEQIEIRQPTSVIWLNATGLDVHAARLNSLAGTQPASVVAGNPGFLGISFTQNVSGSATLHLEYSGKISRNSSAGVFELKDGDERYVYTQFEPTDARRAFPCFDQPDFKTPWELTLRVPKRDMALTNTPQISEADSGSDMKVVKFAASKPLPSYLVAFAVGPFDVVNAGKLGNVPLRIITPKGRGGEATFAAEAVPALLKRLEQYFGRPYPYEKLDSVVMPISNFAMENAGLITYGQSLLLSKPDHDTLYRQRSCAITVAHEMAHQWFGDLVTTAWWDDIWLNEAFATWLESKITSEWKPDWDLSVDDVDDTFRAMRSDSLTSVRRIREPIQSEDDIANAFDDITYQKGAAVIRTLERWIGPDKFRSGVQLYLRQHAWGNATAADFEHAISSAFGRDVAPAFDTFLDQPGVPLVSVEMNCSGGAPKLAMRQQRYLPIGSKGSKQERWDIPVCFTFSANGKIRKQCTLLTTDQAEMPLAGAKSCPDWLLANTGEIGYYHAGYSSDLLDRLMANGAQPLSLPERVGVLQETLALTSSGSVAPEKALSYLPAFASDPHYQVVNASTDIAGLVEERGTPADLLANASRFIARTYGPRATALTWHPREKDSGDDRLLRQTLVPFVARAGRQRQLIDEATTLANGWLDQHGGLDTNLVTPVLITAAEFGDRKLFDRILEAAKQEQDHRQREMLIGILGDFRDPELVRASLNLLLMDDFDLRESFAPLLFGPLQYPETASLPFQFVRDHIDALLAKMPREVGADMAAELPESGAAFCDATHREEVEQFFKDRVKKYTGGPRTLTHVLEDIDLCIARQKVLGPDLAKFLSAQ